MTSWMGSFSDGRSAGATTLLAEIHSLSGCRVKSTNRRPSATAQMVGPNNFRAGSDVAVAFRYLERDGNDCVPDLGWEAVDSDTFGKVEEESTPGFSQVDGRESAADIIGVLEAYRRRYREKLSSMVGPSRLVRSE